MLKTHQLILMPEVHCQVKNCNKHIPATEKDDSEVDGVLAGVTGALDDDLGLIIGPPLLFGTIGNGRGLSTGIGLSNGRDRFLSPLAGLSFRRPSTYNGGLHVEQNKDMVQRAHSHHEIKYSKVQCKYLAAFQQGSSCKISSIVKSFDCMKSNQEAREVEQSHVVGTQKLLADIKCLNASATLVCIVYEKINKLNCWHNGIL